MKPASFEYHLPTTLDETTAILAQLGDEGRILAGGQSLVPLMNFRLALPDHLVDINRVAELAFIREEAGCVAVGAIARQAQVETSALVRGKVPLLADALRWVAHPPIRHRGTVAGSIAHADPAAELPAVALALDARITATGAGGSREITAQDFFVGPFESALRVGELVAKVSYPVAPAGQGCGFAEFTRRHGDFAIAGAAATVTPAGDGIGDARIVLCGVGPRPLRAGEAEAVLKRAGRASAQDIADAAEAAVAGLEPSGDIHGSSEYRVRVARQQVRIAITTAVERARVGR